MLIRARNAKGFTLLELMVVIAIISILAAFSAPTFIRQITKAKLVEVQNIATQDQSVIEEYILLNGRFPEASTFEELTPDLNEDSIIKSIQLRSNANTTTGSFTLTLNQDTGVEAGKEITYRRDEDRHWHCQSTLRAAVLPPQCQSTQGGRL